VRQTWWLAAPRRRVVRVLTQRRLRRLAPLALAFGLAACGSTVQVQGSQQAGGLAVDDGGATSAAAASAVPGGAAPAAVSGSAGASAGTTAARVDQPTTQPGLPRWAPATATAASTIPPTGRGWDRTTVHIGVTTTKDIESVGQSLGIKSINPGNLEQDAEAMVAYLNSQGGIFGRKVKADYFDVRTSDNSDTVGQAICTHFTQDVPVVALLNMTTNGDTPAFDGCIAKAHLPTFAWFTDTGDNAFFASFGGFYNNMPFPSWSRVAHPFARRLLAQGYFTPWDTNIGGPSKTAPVKVGLLEPDAPQGHQIAKLLIAALKAVGHEPDPNDVLFFNSEKDLSATQVKFRADGVTHVIGDELLFLFIETYESQHYRPRYGINSSNAPSLFLEGTMPPAQLVGSMGIGTTPTIDVFESRDPGPGAVPGVALCNAIMAKGGVTYPGDQRYAHTNMYGLCDGFRMIAAAAVAGGGLSGDLLRDGIGLVGPRVASALAFSNGFSPTDRGMPGAARDLFYDDGCSCYRYRGPTYPL
jgi:hypothetical protein